MSPKISRRRFLSLISAATASASIYSYLETGNLLVTRLKLGAGCKTAFLVDTHIHVFGGVEESVIRILSKEEPDVILHGGDVIDKLTASMKPVEKYLAEIDAREKYAVLGNHDYWCGRTDELIALMRKYGFRVLRDEFVETSLGTIFGVDWRDSREYDAGVEADLILAHDPNVAKFMRGEIILAGHTHGGVVIAGLTIFSNSIYTRGLYRLGDGGMIYVSRGLGQMIPLRPTSPLELLIIE